MEIIVLAFTLLFDWLNDITQLKYLGSMHSENDSFIIMPSQLVNS